MSAIATNYRRTNRKHLIILPTTDTTDTTDTTGTTGAMPATEPRWSALVIRLAVTGDDAKLRRLAHMDSARPLSGQALVAEQGGSVIAALSLDDGAAIADPFVASADAVAMLRLRAAQLSRSAAKAA